MNTFCDNRDLLICEPHIFLDGPEGQDICRGSGGQVAATTFTDTDATFISAAVSAGMVLTAYDTVPAEGKAWEIISVDSETELTVSVLRGEASDAAIAPKADTGLSYCVRTFAAQIIVASAALAERLRQACEAEGIAAADFADSAQLRRAVALKVLAEVFTSRATGPDSPEWTKAERYRREFLEGLTQLRLSVDIDGDGTAEQTRSLGNVQMRRV